MSARGRELLGLLPVTLLITAGFTAVFMARQSDLGTTTLSWGGIFLVLASRCTCSSGRGSPTRTRTCSRSWRSCRRSAW